MKSIHLQGLTRAETLILALIIPAYLFRCLEIVQHVYATSSGDITEWLINYAGGFVRRGLTGHLLLTLCAALKIQPEIIIKALGFISYGLLAALLFRQSGQLQCRILLLSPAMLGAPLLLDSLLLKDCLGLVAYIACLVMMRTPLSFSRQLVVNVIASITILSHEMFVFFGLPFLLIIHAMQARQANPRLYPGRALIAALLNMPLPVVVTIIVILFGSNRNMAAIMDFINQSYERAGHPLAYPFVHPTGELETIPWYIKEKLLETSGTFNSMLESPWLLVVWVALVYLYGLCLPQSQLKPLLQPPSGGSQTTHSAADIYIGVAIVHMVFFSPMYLLAIDWGRVVFVSCTAVMATYLYTDKKILFELSNIDIVRSLVQKLRKTLFRPWPALLILFVGLPGNCCGPWQTMFYTSPIAVLVRKANEFFF